MALVVEAPPARLYLYAYLYAGVPAKPWSFGARPGPRSNPGDVAGLVGYGLLARLFVEPATPLEAPVASFSRA